MLRKFEQDKDSFRSLEMTQFKGIRRENLDSLKSIHRWTKKWQKVSPAESWDCVHKKHTVLVRNETVLLNLHKTVPPLPLDHYRKFMNRQNSKIQNCSISEKRILYIKWKDWSKICCKEIWSSIFEAFQMWHHSDGNECNLWFFVTSFSFESVSTFSQWCLISFLVIYMYE